jgi:hypothetical protein
MQQVWSTMNINEIFVKEIKQEIKIPIYKIVIFYLIELSAVSLFIWAVLNNKLVAFLASVLLLAYSFCIHFYGKLLHEALGKIQIIRKILIKEFKEKGYFKDPDSVR